MQTFPFAVRGNTAELRRSDYRLLTSALYSEEDYRNSKKDFWPAFTRSSRRQARLIAWYILLIALEAWVAGRLAANYAKYRSFWLYSWLADKFLFSYISEWHPLLTPYMFVDKDTTVQADIFCTNGILYRGTVTQHFVKDGTLTGFNNDGNGFIQSLRDADPQWRPDSGPIVVLGAGGAARAVVASLAAQGAKEIRLTNRTLDKAQEIADAVGPVVKVLPWDQRADALDGAALLANATSLGMAGKPPLEISLDRLPKGALVGDLIYIPPETPLLAAARIRGNITVNGLGLLLNQARPAFNAWFGVMPEITPALRQAIAATF